MADPSVFTKSHDEVTGMLGSTLDFIGQESAKAIEWQRYRQFQEQEAAKDREFRSGEEKKKHERNVQADAFTSHLDNLDKIGTPEARAARQEALGGAMKNPDQLQAIMGKSPDILNMGIDVEEQLRKFPDFAGFVPAGSKRLTYPQYEEAMKEYQAHRRVLDAKDDNEKWLAIQNYGGVMGDYMKRLNAQAETLSMFGIPTGEVDAEGNPIYDSEGAGDIATWLFEEKQNQYARMSEYLAKGQIPPADVTQTFWSQGDIPSQARDYQRKIKYERASGESAKIKAKIAAAEEEERTLSRELAEHDKYLKNPKDPAGAKYRGQGASRRWHESKNRIKELKKQIKSMNEELEGLGAEASEKEKEAEKWKPMPRPAKNEKDRLNLFPDK